MFGKYLGPLALLLSSCATASAPQAAAPEFAAWAAQCEDWDDWDKPGPPFRIQGNSYYVGTCGIGAILVISNSGLMLIDSGTEAGAQVVLANVRALGFDPANIKILLTSHEHYDHVGGMAVLQQTTGAPLFTSQAALEVLRSGHSAESDPQYGMHPAMRPVADVTALAPGQEVRLLNDSLVLNSISTPGHTPGALSWQWESCEGVDCRTIVYADSMSPISNDTYRFSDHPEYVAAYREGIARVAALDCDILLTPHPSASDMRDKLLVGDLASGTNCRDYAASITQRLDTRLAEEAAQ
jgi:metallo-beta-lactamase class B